MKRESSILIMARLDLIKAHAEGKPIQQKLLYQTVWTSTENPEFLNPGFQFRLAPRTIRLARAVTGTRRSWFECREGGYALEHPELYEYMYVEEKL